jgi:mannose-1-phosphate guanylyltransferase/phosphomannomutase
VTLKPCIKLWPYKKIKEDSIINKNLIWGTKASRVLFGERGISGEFNIEITPEYASLLGAAFASSLNKAASVIISSDDKPPSRLIKESIISGVLSSGSKVIDIGDVVIPLNRFGVKLYSGSGGIHVSMDRLDGRLRIELINEAGGNIDRKTEKKVENLFFREDFERCSIDMVRSVVRIENFTQLYLQNIEPHIKNLVEIRNSAYRILIASPSEVTLNIASSLLNNIGCSVTKDYSISENKSIEDYSKHIGDIVKANKHDLGVILSENGENIILVDETGLVIDKEKYPILASLITLKSDSTEKLIIPHMSTVNIEKLAQKYNTEVIRAKSPFSELINTVLKQPMLDNASQLQYILYFDGIYAVAKILDFLIENSTTLHSLGAEIPPIHIRTQELNCDFEQRGSIIRRLIEEGKSDNLELFDGIKLSSEKGWSLIIPDNERSVFNIYTEGFSEEYADELSGSIVDKLKRLIIDNTN